MDQNDTIKECFHVAGDQPDPTGYSDLRGVAPGYNLTRSALGHPKVLAYVHGKQAVLTVDVYAIPGEPMKLHLMCPVCVALGRTHVALHIHQGQKAFSYDPGARVPPWPDWSEAERHRAFPEGMGGLLNVDPFGCSWEETPELRRGFGLASCTWRVAIVNNVARPV